jgi:ankyrin repeat protein
MTFAVSVLVLGALYLNKKHLMAVATEAKAPIHVAPKGVDISLYSRNLEMRRAMLHAAQRGQTQLVRQLLADGAPVDLQLGNGRTPLSFAAEYGHAELVRFLLAHGAEVNARTSDGSTPLIYAVANGYPDAAAALLAHGADVSLKDADGRTALRWAAHRHSRKVYDALRKRGVRVSWKDAVMVGDVATARALLPQDADADQADRDGSTLLMMAAASGSREMAQFLLDRGANIDAANRYGMTPLSLAAGQRDQKVVRLLLARGASRKSAPEAQGPLASATVSGRIDLVRMLLQRGADIHKDGVIALGIAIRYRDAEIIRLLEQFGAGKDTTQSPLMPYLTRRL